MAAFLPPKAKHKIEYFSWEGPALIRWGRALLCLEMCGEHTHLLKGIQHSNQLICNYNNVWGCNWVPLRVCEFCKAGIEQRYLGEVQHSPTNVTCSPSVMQVLRLRIITGELLPFRNKIPHERNTMRSKTKKKKIKSCSLFYAPTSYALCSPV